MGAPAGGGEAGETEQFTADRVLVVFHHLQSLGYVYITQPEEHIHQVITPLTTADVEYLGSPVRSRCPPVCEAEYWLPGRGAPLHVNVRHREVSLC